MEGLVPIWKGVYNQIKTHQTRISELEAQIKQIQTEIRSEEKSLMLLQKQKNTLEAIPGANLPPPFVCPRCNKDTKAEWGHRKQDCDVVYWECDPTMTCKMCSKHVTRPYVHFVETDSGSGFGADYWTCTKGKTTRY